MPTGRRLDEGTTAAGVDLRDALSAGLAALREAVAAALGQGAVPALAGSPPVTGRSPRWPAQLTLATPVPRGSAPVSGRGVRGSLRGDSTSTEPDSVVESAPEVLSRAQAGDGEAFAELYDQYVGLVYRYIYYRVSSVALAEDLTSETFVRALRRLPSFQWQGRDFGAWLVTIARNLIADHYKSGRYRLEIATDDILLAASSSATTDSPEREVLESLTNATLLEAVKRLGAEQQECIVLRFLQGLSVAETALAMGKNEGAIKALQYRAVRTLGRMLPPDLAE